MIRRDYILRMIQEIGEALARIRSLKRDQKLQDATVVVDEQFNQLVGAGPQAVVNLSETELLAKLMQEGPSQLVRHKALLLTALLKEAGDIAEAAGRPEEGRACYLKGLHLLLEVLTESDAFEYPDFVPKVELFVDALRDSPLPTRTLASLMHHYERTGQLAKAEDALFLILEAHPDSVEALDLGIGFYERMRNRSDAALESGNLPRPEIESGFAELRERKRQLPKPAGEKL